MTLSKYLINSVSLLHSGSPWILFRGVVKDPALPERKSPKGRWVPWATGGCSVISHPQNTPCLWPSYRLEQAVRQWLEHLNLIAKQSFPEENRTWTLCCFWNHFLFNSAQGNVWSPPILKEKVLGFYTFLASEISLFVALLVYQGDTPQHSHSWPKEFPLPLGDPHLDKDGSWWPTEKNSIIKQNEAKLVHLLSI